MKSMIKSILMTGTVLAGVTLASGHAFAGDKVFIKSLAFLGSGCTPADSSGALNDLDNDGLPDEFNILFSNYIAFSGPGTTPLNWRKNCNINVTLQLPQGFQFSIVDVNYVGSVTLPKGVTGTQQSKYSFVFFPGSATLFSNFKGPLGPKDYQFIDELGIASLVWSPCGLTAPLNIRTEVFLKADRGVSLMSEAGAAQITTDQIDGVVKEKYHFQWRRCGSGGDGKSRT